MSETILIEFEGTDAPVAFANCRELTELLPTIFPGWPHRRLLPGSTESEPFITMERAKKGYRLSSHFMEQIISQPDAVNALCSLVVELAWASLRTRPDHLCVHSAAVEFSGRLVLFPNGRRAGKSTLTACLARQGRTVFTDDFLSIEIDAQNHPLGLASGVAPRIRNPLPADFSPAMADYVVRSARLSNRQYSYLQLDNALAPRGAKLPIGAMVLLQRETGVTATLRKADMADVLKAVIVQNFSRAQNAGRILQVLHFLTSTVELRVLRYSRAEDAVGLLAREFADWPDELQPGNLPPAPDFLLPEPGLDDPAPVLLTCTAYVQSKAVVEYRADNAQFLADSDGFAIHQLNEMSSAVWGVLDKPATLLEILDVFCDAFPNQPRERIEADIQQLLGQFVQNRLVVPATVFAGRMAASQ